MNSLMTDTLSWHSYFFSQQRERHSPNGGADGNVLRSGLLQTLSESKATLVEV